MVYAKSLCGCPIFVRTKCAHKHRKRRGELLVNGDFRTQRLNVCSGCETATVWEYFQSDLRTYDQNLYEKIQI